MSELNTLYFTRKLDTGDSLQDIVLEPNAEYWLRWQIDGDFSRNKTKIVLSNTWSDEEHSDISSVIVFIFSIMCLLLIPSFKGPTI